RPSPAPRAPGSKCSWRGISIFPRSTNCNSGVPMSSNDSCIDRGAAVLALAEPILRHLARPGLTDLVINQPGIVFVESDTGWERIEDPALDHDKLMALATAIATYGHQKVDATHPILSASLPTGERIQMVVPPAV